MSGQELANRPFGSWNNDIGPVCLHPSYSRWTIVDHIGSDVRDTIAIPAHKIRCRRLPDDTRRRDERVHKRIVAVCEVITDGNQSIDLMLRDILARRDVCSEMQGIISAVIGVATPAGGFEEESLGIQCEAGDIVWKHLHCDHSLPSCRSSAC